MGKLSLRFVPEQAHSTLIECLRVHLEKKFEQMWSANKMELQVRLLMFFCHGQGENQSVCGRFAASPSTPHMLRGWRRRRCF